MNEEEGDQAETAASLEIHPARQAMIREPASHEQTAQQPPPPPSDYEPKNKSRRRKPQPFAKEAKFAEERKQEARKRREAFEENKRIRQQKLEERERHRRAMAKARMGGKNGQRKLGRESKILLEKVQRLVAES